jgi:serine protease Do
MPYGTKCFCILIIFGLSFSTACGAIGTAPQVPLSKVFQKVNPSVVMIIAERSQESNGNSNPITEVGAGVLISEDGRILTAAHTVNIADKIAVNFLNGHTEKASVVASSSQGDIALLQLEAIPEDIAIARLGDSDTAMIGDEILVIGAPYGIDHTLSVGHISGKRQSKTVCHQLTPFEFIQTDAALNKGNSGGPMFDINGNVIGIVSGIVSSSGGSEGLGFAVTINTARGLLLDQNSFWIGFDAYMLYGDMAKAFNLPQDAGLLVQNVADYSPGDALGLRAGDIPIKSGKEKFLIGGDIVLSIQGFPVTHSLGDVCAIQDVIGGFTSETEIELIILRGGKRLTLTNKK